MKNDRTVIANFLICSYSLIFLYTLYMLLPESIHAPMKSLLLISSKEIISSSSREAGTERQEKLATSQNYWKYQNTPWTPGQVLFLRDDFALSQFYMIVAGQEKPVH